MASDDEAIAFTRGAAKRIANAVRIVEIGERTGGALEWDVQEAGPFRLRLGTYSGDWQTCQFKTVTLWNSTATMEVYNWTTPAIGGNTNSTSESRFVLFGRVNSTQSAVEIQLPTSTATCSMRIGGINLATLPGYSAGVDQVLGHNDSNCLVWFATTTCQQS